MAKTGRVMVLYIHVATLGMTGSSMGRKSHFQIRLIAIKILIAP
jgi:hypothetical protein